MLDCTVFLVIFQKTHQLRTKTFGATATSLRPRAFCFPCLLVASAPRFTHCHDHKRHSQSPFTLHKQNNFILHGPLAGDCVLGEAVVTLFFVETSAAKHKQKKICHAKLVADDPLVDAVTVTNIMHSLSHEHTQT